MHGRSGWQPRLNRDGQKVTPDDAVEPLEQRVADERVPDAHFGEVRELAEQRQVTAIEIVTRVCAEPE
jgi:hypothetical protein